MAIIRDTMHTDKAILMISDSEADSNMYYATGFYAPDPFVYIQKGREKTIVMSDLEIDRAKTQSQADAVLSFSKYERLTKRRGLKFPKLIDVVVPILREMGIKRLLVPTNFNVAYADFLRKKGFKLKVKKDPFFDSREVKREEEVQHIVKTQRATERVMAKAIAHIKEAHIENGLLYSRRRDALTSESIKKLIASELLKDGLIARHTIVSCGDQSCEPHNVGSGHLKMNEPIILDVFPRDDQTGYCADITRTVVRGKAASSLKKMYKAVLSCQELVFKLAKNGAKGNLIHRQAQKHLKDMGFKSGTVKGKKVGFFHGTGHGIGLDVHETPRISTARHTLKTGNIVTVEPGLYYPGIGGVRLEDVILITDDGCVNLTEFPKELEI